MLIAFTPRLNGQDILRFFEPAPDLHRNRTITVAAAETAISAGSLAGLWQFWYKDYNTSSFHFFNDNDEWLQMDKYGHSMAAYYAGSLSYGLLKWSGIQERKAVWIGGLTGFAYQGVIEMFDGFSSGWGFSSGDILANGFGSALFISQQLYFHEQHVQLKYSFQRSPFAKYRPALLGSSIAEQLIKDYNAQTYWISFSPATWTEGKTIWPKWLNIAAGIGAEGMTGGTKNAVIFNAQGNQINFERYRQFYLSLDINLSRLPVKSPFLKTICHTLGFLKIPAPGLMWSKQGFKGGVY
ncbi:MAG: DUF2279 domain-containing protein [Bacteroidia bacterium]